MNRQIGVLSFVFTLIGACGIYYFYKRKVTKTPPTNWRKIGYVKKLYIYPLKSGRYMDMERVGCEKYGLCVPAIENMYQLKDRSFMVYSEAHNEGKWMGIYNKMVLVTLSSADKKHIRLEAPGKDSLVIPVPVNNNNKTISFQSWNKNNVPLIDCGDEAAIWFSQFLLEKDSGLRLGFHEKPFCNNLSLEQGLYTNFAPIMVMNYKSMADLNEKLKDKVTDTYFRSNIVVDGPDLEPFAEDSFVWLKIGDVVARNFYDCVRCIAITVDPETGLRDKSRETLKALSKYRMSDGPPKGPKMGIYLEVIVPGEISVDDEVFVGIKD